MAILPASEPSVEVRTALSASSFPLIPTWLGERLLCFYRIITKFVFIRSPSHVRIKETKKLTRQTVEELILYPLDQMTWRLVPNPQIMTANISNEAASGETERQQMAKCSAHGRRQVCLTYRTAHLTSPYLLHHEQQSSVYSCGGVLTIKHITEDALL